MELRHLRYFVAVAEELNVRRAAERLHVSQPPLTRQIHDLEEEVGAQLFVRGHDGMQLTEAGRFFLREAHQILSQSQRAVQLARAADRGEAGHLNLAYTAAFYDPVFARAIRVFRRRFPAVVLNLRELLTYQQIPELLEKRLDLGYVGLRFVELEQELVFECVRRGVLWVALPPDHPLAKRRRVPLRALAKEPFVGPPRTAPAYCDALLNFCRSAGFVPEIVQEGNNAQCILELVSAGVGVSLVPDTFRHLLSTEVEFRELAPAAPPLEFHIAWRRDSQSHPLHSFLKTLREQLSGAPA
ncbi:MAG TPA: LysR substrate-binding domain-containing protein [Verrucomicrobiae bacterium]